MEAFKMKETCMQLDLHSERGRPSAILMMAAVTSAGACQSYVNRLRVFDPDRLGHIWKLLRRWGITAARQGITMSSSSRCRIVASDIMIDIPRRQKPREMLKKIFPTIIQYYELIHDNWTHAEDLNYHQLTHTIADTWPKCCICAFLLITAT
jgi:hypothetical protein